MHDRMLLPQPTHRHTRTMACRVPNTHGPTHLHDGVLRARAVHVVHVPLPGPLTPRQCGGCHGGSGAAGDGACMASEAGQLVGHVRLVQLGRGGRGRRWGEGEQRGGGALIYAGIWGSAATRFTSIHSRDECYPFPMNNLAHGRGDRESAEARPPAAYSGCRCSPYPAPHSPPRGTAGHPGCAFRHPANGSRLPHSHSPCLRRAPPGRRRRGRTPPQTAACRPAA